MKKTLSVLLLLAMLLAMVACGDTEQPDPTLPSYVLPYPYINPKDYCDMDLDFDRLSVTLSKEFQVQDEDVDEYIHKLMYDFIPDQIQKVKVTDRPIKEGDVVYFYYYGTVDGATFEASTNHTDESPKFVYVGGDDVMLKDVGVEGFASQLIGIVPNTTASNVSTEGVVCEGDVVYFDGSVVYADGDDKYSESLLDVRVNLSDVPTSYGADFAAQMIGQSIGTTFDFTVTEDFDGDGDMESKTYYLYLDRAGKEQTVTVTANFPKLYPDNPDLAGKTASFEVVVSYIEEYVYPELTESFVVVNCQYYPKTNDPVSEYREYVRKNIEAVYESYINQALEGKLLDLLCESMTNVDYPYPEQTLIYAFETNVQQIELLMEEEKKKYPEGKCPFNNFQDFALLYYGLEDMTTDDVDGWIMEKCERNVKENLAIFYVGRALGFSISDSDVRSFAAALANQYNQNEGFAKYSADDILESLGKEYIICSMMYAKVMDYLMQRVEIVFQ